MTVEQARQRETDSQALRNMQLDCLSRLLRGSFSILGFWAITSLPLSPKVYTFPKGLLNSLVVADSKIRSAKGSSLTLRSDPAKYGLCQPGRPKLPPFFSLHCSNVDVADPEAGVEIICSRWRNSQETLGCC